MSGFPLEGSLSRLARRHPPFRRRPSLALSRPRELVVFDFMANKKCFKCTKGPSEVCLYTCEKCSYVICGQCRNTGDPCPMCKGNMKS
jgi:hypothetical protein